MNYTKSVLLFKASEKVREILGNDGAGHDWWHIKRVVEMAKKIHSMEGGDLFIVEMAAWLHDIADHKYHNGDHTMGPKVAREWMEEQEMDEEDIQKIVQIIKEISYKGANVATPMSSLEGKIVQDADRLDAIGAIGIARTFAYGGSRDRLMYDPDIKADMHDDFESYKKTTSPTINHFYEKLLLLKDRMNTDHARELAEERHAYMETFLEQFYAEWDAKR